MGNHLVFQNDKFKDIKVEKYRYVQKKSSYKLIIAIQQGHKIEVPVLIFRGPGYI